MKMIKMKTKVRNNMHQLIINREFNTSVSNLFKAWCQVETIKNWFAPGNMTVPEASAEVNEGGNYRIVMQDTDGVQHIIGGKYYQVVENEKLTFSWQWEGSPNTTKVCILFKALADNKASLELTHSEFDDEETRDKHNQGWQGCLGNLPKVL